MRHRHTRARSLRSQVFPWCNRVGRRRRQLEDELRAGAWLALECDPSLVIKDRVVGWRSGKPKPVWTELMNVLDTKEAKQRLSSARSTRSLERGVRGGISLGPEALSLRVRLCRDSRQHNGATTVLCSSVASCGACVGRQGGVWDYEHSRIVAKCTFGLLYGVTRQTPRSAVAIARGRRALLQGDLCATPSSAS
jgi:hypothetical protein